MSLDEAVNKHLGDVVERLLQAVPELEPLYQKHLSQNFDDPIPYLFVAEVARFIAERSTDLAQHDLIKRVFDFFENELATEPAQSRTTYDLIGAGFGEALENEQALPVLLSLMPTHLRSMMRELGSP